MRNIFFYNLSKLFEFRKSCGIVEETESIVITGGLNSLEIVFRYNIDGEQEALDTLREGRHSHACGRFENSESQQVHVHLEP